MKVLSTVSRTITGLVAAAAVACTAAKAPASDATAGTAMQGSMSGMGGSMGTAGNMAGMMSVAAMDSMRSHMKMMDTVTTARIQASIPAHRQMVANMLSQMNADMRGMNIAGDAAWSATADSIREDLLRMPEMTAAEVKRMMPAHRARVARLLGSHQKMMGMMPK